MGRMVDGEWRVGGFGVNERGAFERKATTFRDALSPEEAASGRFRLYVAYACPWAHRTLILRALRGLGNMIPISVVHPYMGADGWSFEDGPKVLPDPGGAHFLRDVYRRAKGDYTGRVTVPILFDEAQGRIVNNESREIIRMFDDAFAALGQRDVNLHPAEHHEAMEAAMDAIYEPINNGVYKAGFAQTQEAYDEAVSTLFHALDHWEGVLGQQRYLCGDILTEADICLFTTLVRFDLVYHYHFKCNRRRIRDYPNLWGFTREIYQLPGVAETTHFDHITQHYYRSHESVNPHRIVPVGPEIDFDAPHGRG